jgi:alginate O-acetyltransferase complex protein AlgI
MSLGFYAYGEPKWIVIMLVTVLVDYLAGKIIDQFRGRPMAKAALIVATVITIGFLAVFKYANLFITSVNGIFNSELGLLSIGLPIGISFYTFQALTYVVDVYRGDTRVQHNFFKLLLYVSLFPQLIAGPIVRYVDIENELNYRKVSAKDFASGVIRFSVGLTKKAVFANIAGMLCKKLIDNDLSGVSTLGMWIGIAAFALQIYFDFSAYSDMAIGLGYMLGFRFRENFDYPYTSTSVSDFWRRWHISLTSFFREYVYIPMGGNRSHFVRNMLIVWLLTGFWHGASWNYLLWGLYYFVFLMLERIFLGDILKKIPKVFGWIYSIAVVLVGWVFFYFEDAVKLKYALSIMFGVVKHGIFDSVEKTVVINFLPFIIIGIIACMPVSKLVKGILNKVSEKSKVGGVFCDVVTALFVAGNLFISTAALVGSSYNPFLYFRF